MLNANIFIGWIQSNKDWLFDGIGVTILIAIIGFGRKFIFNAQTKEADTVLEKENITERVSGDGNIIGNGNISANVVNVYGKEYEKSDIILINKNLGTVFAKGQEDSFSKKVVEEKDTFTKRDIDSYDTTTFFDYRFAKAFPGVRGAQEFVDPKECVDRLEILLKEPLSKNGLSHPIWWFRGSSNLYIQGFSRISESKFLMNRDEIEINRIVAYGAPVYYKKFVYVEAKPEKTIGLYEDITEEHIEEYRKTYGVYHEEYALYNGTAITRAEYDDDAAVIDGKVVDLENKAELRVRYLTPYNFIICAQFNPINETKNDVVLERYLNGVLEGKYKVENIVQFVDGLGRHRNDK